MYLELVKQVSQVEQETEASVRQAAQQAQQMQEEAERSGRALVEQTRRDLQQLETQRRRPFFFRDHFRFRSGQKRMKTRAHTAIR